MNGRKGAKVQSWSTSNPRALLLEIVEKHPRKSQESLLALFQEAIGDHGPIVAVIVEYWFANNYEALVSRPKRAALRVVEPAAREELAASLTDKVKARAVEMVLLDFVLPNGKPLRDCTGLECSQAGGWLLRVADRVHVDQVVGAVMSEADVRAVWSAAVSP